VKLTDQLELNWSPPRKQVRWWQGLLAEFLGDHEVSEALTTHYPWKRAEIAEEDWSRYQPTTTSAPQQIAYALKMHATIDWADSICTSSGIRFGDWGTSLCEAIADDPGEPWWAKYENTLYAEVAISALALFGLIRTHPVKSRRELAPCIRDRPLDDVLSLRMWTGGYCDGAPLVYRWWEYALETPSETSKREAPRGKSIMDMMLERDRQA
jgi:hypothetical protein